MQVESEGEAEAACAAVLTPPLSLEGGLAAELRPANLAQRVLSLFLNVRPGSDLSHFQVRACEYATRHASATFCHQLTRF